MTSGAELAFLPQPKTGFFRERGTVDCRWDRKKAELALQLPGTRDDQSDERSGVASLLTPLPAAPYIVRNALEGGPRMD